MDWYDQSRVDLAHLDDPEAIPNDVFAQWQTSTPRYTNMERELPIDEYKDEEVVEQNSPEKEGNLADQWNEARDALHNASVNLINSPEKPLVKNAVNQSLIQATRALAQCGELMDQIQQTIAICNICRKRFNLVTGDRIETHECQYDLKKRIREEHIIDSAPPADVRSEQIDEELMPCLAIKPASISAKRKKRLPTPSDRQTRSMTRANMKKFKQGMGRAIPANLVTPIAETASEDYYNYSQRDIFSEDSTEQCMGLVSQFRSLHPTLRLKTIRMMNQQPLQEEEEEEEEEEEDAEEYEEECQEEEDEEIYDDESEEEQTEEQSELEDDILDILTGNNMSNSRFGSNGNNADLVQKYLTFLIGEALWKEVDKVLTIDERRLLGKGIRQQVDYDKKLLEDAEKGICFRFKLKYPLKRTPGNMNETHALASYQKEANIIREGVRKRMDNVVRFMLKMPPNVTTENFFGNMLRDPVRNVIRTSAASFKN